MEEMRVSAVRPVTFEGGQVRYAVPVGKSVQELLQKAGHQRGAILILVQSHVIIPGLIEQLAG